MAAKPKVVIVRKRIAGVIDESVYRIVYDTDGMGDTMMQITHLPSGHSVQGLSDLSLRLHMRNLLRRLREELRDASKKT